MLVAGCSAYLECRIIQEPHNQQQYDLFIAEVVAAQADSRVFSDGRWHFEDADPAYVLQMAIYAAVLRRLYPERAVEAALVWTDGPKLMAVPHGLMDAALENAR